MPDGKPVLASELAASSATEEMNSNCTSSRTNVGSNKDDNETAVRVAQSNEASGFAQTLHEFAMGREGHQQEAGSTQIEPKLIGRANEQHDRRHVAFTSDEKVGDQSHQHATSEKGLPNQECHRKNQKELVQQQVEEIGMQLDVGLAACNGDDAMAMPSARVEICNGTTAPATPMQNLEPITTTTTETPPLAVHDLDRIYDDDEGDSRAELSCHELGENATERRRCSGAGAQSPSADELSSLNTVVDANELCCDATNAQMASVCADLDTLECCPVAHSSQASGIPAISKFKDTDKKPENVDECAAKDYEDGKLATLECELSSSGAKGPESNRASGRGKSGFSICFLNIFTFYLSLCA